MELHEYKFRLAAVERENRRLRWYLAVQKDAINALEDALRFMNVGQEPVKGALALLKQKRLEIENYQAKAGPVSLVS